MLLSELIEELQRYAQMYHTDYEVVMCKDAEGNEVSPLDEIYMAYYEAETTYSGQLISDEKIKKSSYLRGVATEVLVLWPTN